MSSPVNTKETLQKLWDTVHEKCITLNRKCKEDSHNKSGLRKCNDDYFECIQKEGWNLNDHQTLRSLWNITDHFEYPDK